MKIKKKKIKSREIVTESKLKFLTEIQNVGRLVTLVSINTSVRYTNYKYNPNPSLLPHVHEVPFLSCIPGVLNSLRNILFSN